MTECCDTRSFLERRLAAKEAELLRIDAAVSALTSGAQMYSLDTGQTRQTVTKANLASLTNRSTQLEGEIMTLRTRLCGTGSFIGRPGF